MTYYEIIVGTLAYLIVTFPYAYVWHMKIFKEKYLQWQYFGRDAKPILGLLSMVIQGIVLSYGYSLLAIDHASLLAGLGYATIMGVFFWSTHVIAAMAKHGETRTLEFFLMETVYLSIQFVVFGILISFTYRAF